MFWILLIAIVLAVIILPGFWVRKILTKYSEPADRYLNHGTGGELARHLLDRYELNDVKVEASDMGDHYDPAERAVRLTEANFSSHSLTAITVAAHEVGHALQHARGESLFSTRQRLAAIAIYGERIGQLLLVAAPIVMLIARIPQASVAILLLAVGSMALSTLVHLVTLPVELDASYGKALPILEQGNYLREGDLPHARRILKAAALTYVAGSLASLLNLGRWIAILRR